jgi:hypothetical protein
MYLDYSVSDLSGSDRHMTPPSPYDGDTSPA